MKKYLDNRNDYYVVEKFSAKPAGMYNSAEQYNALLRRVSSMSETMSKSIGFMDENADDVEATIESAISTLETKVQIIRSAARFISKIKMDLGSVSTAADISLVDLSKGTFEGITYSATDKGIVLANETITHLKEGKE